MGQRPTIVDVAKASGVTDGTVSRALSGDPRVREETRLRVLKAAKQLGYRPHLQARALKRGVTGLIGVFAEGGSWILYDPYFGRLLGGLARAAEDQGQRLLLYFPEVRGQDKETDPLRANLHFSGIEELGDGRLDGAVILGGPLVQEKDLDTLAARLPLVLLSRNEPRPGFFQLLSGAEERSRTAAEELRMLGHRHLAFFGLYPGSSFNLASLKGMGRGLGERGKVEEAKLLHPDPCDPAALATAVDQMLARPATGWVLGIPEQAAVIQDLLRERAVRIPRDLSLISFGPRPNPARARQPLLSLLEADLAAEGRECLQMLAEARLGKPPRSQVMRWGRPAESATLAPPRR